jgi:hypothetical protein
MASIPRRRGGLLVAGLMTALAAVPARAQDPNIEYWRDYEVAFLDWCAQDSPTGCQCVMEALEATLTFDRFARLVGGGGATMRSDAGFAAALAAARVKCAGEAKLTAVDR